MKKLFFLIVMVMIGMTGMAQSQSERKCQTMNEICQDGHRFFESGSMRDQAEEYRRKANTGDAESQFMLAYCYEYGHGVKEDKYEAARWFRKAAEKGNAKAQQSLGLCYFKGYGVPQSNDNCAYWIKKSMDNGMKFPSDFIFESFGDQSALDFGLAIFLH